MREHHAETRERCFSLSLDGHRAPAIARQVGIHEVTVERLLKEVRQLRRTERDAAGEQEDHLTFLAEQDQVMAEASYWLDQLCGGAAKQDLGLNVSGLLNTKSTASKRKAEALGLSVRRCALTDTRGADPDIVDLIRTALEDPGEPPRAG